MLAELDHLDLLKENTLVIAESSLQTEIQDELFEHLKVLKIKEYKTNKHTFLQKVQEG